MKKVLKRRKGVLTPVYAWAVDYSVKKAKERRESLKPNAKKRS